MSRILVIDDNPFYRVALKTGLERVGYEVLALERCDDAVVIAQSWKPDAILLDLDLPGVGGTALCAQLKGQPHTAGVPVIFATARCGESDRIAGFEAGADDFVTKPFTFRELELRLRVLIERIRSN